MGLHKQSGRHLCWTLPCTCPLLATDRATGRCLTASACRQLDVPFLREALQLCPHRSRMSTSDRASANDASEEALHADAIKEGGPSLRLPCFAHIASTTQQRSFETIPDVISGVVNTSLAKRPMNAPSTFRAHLADFLFRHAHAAEEARPPPGHSHERRLQAVLQLCSPGTDDRSSLRRTILETCLGGDTTASELWWYCGKGALIKEETRVGQHSCVGSLPTLHRRVPTTAVGEFLVGA